MENGFPKGLMGFPLVGGQYEGQQPGGGLQSLLSSNPDVSAGSGLIQKVGSDQVLPMNPENAEVIRNKLFSTTEPSHLPHFVSFMKMFGVDLSKILPEGTGETAGP